MGIHFRHRVGRDVHGPSYYLHLQPGETFAAVGLWHPERETLQKVRTAVAEKPTAWRRAAHSGDFAVRYRLSGDVLKRAPAGFDPEHPLIEDLKRKDFVGVAMLDEKSVTSEDFLPAYAELCRAATPYARFLCEAVGAPF